jgi:GNAT superfamily N-acetyltransferase
MIHTEFLPDSQYTEYGEWLQGQDKETLDLYFGISAGNHIIDALMDAILTDKDRHYILVAKKNDQWIGTIHIAASGTLVEFGIIVSLEFRGLGIASNMLEEAIIWARNRGYTELFMHCLGWNKPIRHLCHKNGLRPRNVYGDSEVQIQLDPPNWVTLNKEITIKQRNLFHMFLDNSQFLYREIYG